MPLHEQIYAEALARGLTGQRTVDFACSFALDPRCCTGRRSKVIKRDRSGGHGSRRKKYRAWIRSWELVHRVKELLRN